jgi:ribonucleoside-diphosphate reductase alpha chain
MSHSRSAAAPSVTARGAGVSVPRRFTEVGTHPFDCVEWEIRDAVIGDPADPAFEQRGVEFPVSWSQNATNIVAQKYFRGRLGTPERESSVKQMIGRVAGTIAGWGREGGYFASDADAEAFEAELTHILLNQMAAFNSPVWFNVGFEESPQCSACFILSVEDTIESILDWNTKEGMIFRGGSGSGINLSKIRGSKEHLSKGGYASGPVSFMRGADAWAGTIKSGGKCFKEGTLVATPTGMQPIERLRIGDQVLTHKGPRAIADFMPNGRKLCHQVLTREGYEVEVTAGHKFAYWNEGDGGFGVKPIEAFEPGDALYAPVVACEGGAPIPLLSPEIADPATVTTTVEMQLPSELDERFAYVLGLLHGDGHVRVEYPYRVAVSFCKDEAGRDSASRFSDYCRELFGEEPLLLGDYDGHQQLGYSRKRLVDFLVANGLAKGKADSLGFPEVMFRAKPEIRAAFLAGMIDADGSYQRRGGWAISSIDRTFLVDLQRLLMSLGVPSKIKLSRERRGNWQPLYRLHIVGYTFVDRLVKQIDPHSAKAQVNYVPSPGADKGWGYRPSVFGPLTGRVHTRGGYRLVERSVGMNETSGYRAVARLAEHPDTAVAEYAEELSTCVQLTLESVTPTEMAQTYDIEVEDVHLLCANGIYASNTRRAAKMIVLDVDHPDILDFIWCKAREEEKAAALRDAGFDMRLDSDAFASIQYQNANNSVRVTDEFMERAEHGEEWELTARNGGEVIERVNARELLDQLADAAWRCADPGVQYDTTTNEWHTCPNSGRINASNPCSEYMHVDDSACNLASLNLMKFRRPDGSFDVDSFEHAVDVVILAQEIVVGPSSYPTEEIGRNARAFRQLGLGYANLGALLMANGLAYDSDEGRALCGAITALMTGRAYRTSAEVAGAIGPYERYEENRDPHNHVMRKHLGAAYSIDDELCADSELLAAARRACDEAVDVGVRNGYRNAQATVLAPTGTISFLMDCDTTGIEPDFSLVKFKELVGGGQMTIVNRTVPLALETLGYAPEQIEAIEAHLAAEGTVAGAPGLAEEHLPVFDVAVGQRAISPMGHIKMMAAAQPFISGAISKTVNLPESVTVEDVAGVYTEGWKLGLKALAIYRDGSKTAQALKTDAGEKKNSEAEAAVEPEPARPVRRRMPRERQSLTHKFSVGGHEGYITAGEYDDGTLGEIFLTDIGKEGSTIKGMMNAFATAISIGLQYGVPLETLVRKFAYVRFEPEGYTGNPEIPFAKSMPDYIMRWLASRYGDADLHEELGILTPEVRARKASQEALMRGDTASPPASEPEAEDSPANDAANGGGNGAPKGARPRAGGRRSDPKPPASALTDEPPAIPAKLQGLDLGPACAQCGGMMQRTGSCYTCSSCGNNTGCG